LAIKFSSLKVAEPKVIRPNIMLWSSYRLYPNVFKQLLYSKELIIHFSEEFSNFKWLENR
jgi:hypothetical protein